MKIDSLDALRQLYAQPQERAVLKEIPSLDVHCRNFIALSPFVILATTDMNFNVDASPRGGEPGFIKVTEAGDILIPDAPGNNRLDSLENILSTQSVGLLFLTPGFDETLRVNGSATLSNEIADIASCPNERRAPKLVVRISVTAAYLHCAKAFMRSKLWNSSSRVEREVLPTIGQMIGDQTGMAVSSETKEELAKRYEQDL